ncbi:MAG: hypothetical protein J4G13_08885 [Dehalococcoidia bacterium]|nr:hypothetical protein [Dehalococcoidia bacterium]
MTTPENNERMAADIADLKEGQARLEEGQAELREGQTRLEEGQTELREGQARLEERVGRLEAGQTRLEDRMDRMDDTVGHLVGAELEREVHANIVNIASRQLGLNRVRILQSKIVTRSSEFQDAIDDAEEQKLITEDQASHLEQSDVILAARRKNDRISVHVVAEVSGLIGERDIDRAWDRAKTLARIKRTPVIPAVIGGSVAPPQQETANQKGVTVIITSRLSG